MTDSARTFSLRLPATSANIGPAFDTAAVALNLHLEVTARRSEKFSIRAQGRDAAACGKLEGNLILETYREILRESGRPLQPLHLDVRNEIPLGMGCGSSASARLAGIALAVEFGELGWQEEQILAVSTALEGHPDNVTACWLGGMTVSAVLRRNAARLGAAPRVQVAHIEVPAHWRAVVVFPRDPVLTEESRQVLPDQYSRADVVANLQSCSLLVAAFASGKSELLRAAMDDRLHQPFRTTICPLLQETGAFLQIPGVLGVALSGAGPGLLLIIDQDLDPAVLDRELKNVLAGMSSVEVLQCGFEAAGAAASVVRSTLALSI